MGPYCRRRAMPGACAEPLPVVLVSLPAWKVPRVPGAGAAPGKSAQLGTAGFASGSVAAALALAAAGGAAVERGATLEPNNRPGESRGAGVGIGECRCRQRARDGRCRTLPRCVPGSARPAEGEERDCRGLAGAGGGVRFALWRARVPKRLRGLWRLLGAEVAFTRPLERGFEVLLGGLSLFFGIT